MNTGGTMMKKKILTGLGVVLMLAIAAVSSAQNRDPGTLNVAVLPDESPSTLIKKNEGFKKYLEAQLGKKIEIMVTTDYSSMIEAMRHGRLDLAYFGPLSYVLAKQKSKLPIEAFAAQMSKGSPTYTGVVVANVAASVNSINDIQGKNMAYGDKASTSSHLIPKAILAEKGLEAKKHYQEHFLGAHDAVAIAVQNGNAQAGGLSKPIFDSLVERKIIDLEKVKVLEESKPFPNYPWTMRSDLKPQLKEKIREVFFSLKDQEILKPLKADGFAPIQDKDYDGIRQLGKLLNLDFSKLAG
jgi:phosphonate transport system substrate-binding protein